MTYARYNYRAMSHRARAALVLAAVAALLIVAQWSRVPYPILLVLGGLGLALIPGSRTSSSTRTWSC